MEDRRLIVYRIVYIAELPELEVQCNECDVFRRINDRGMESMYIPNDGTTAICAACFRQSGDEHTATAISKNKGIPSTAQCEEKEKHEDNLKRFTYFFY